MSKPSKGDAVWLVSPEGTIHTYTFIEEASSPGSKSWMLAYGTHHKQRNWRDSRQCYLTRQSACAAAAKMLRERAGYALDRAAELEQEAAGLPVIPRDPTVVYVKKKGEGNGSEG